MQAIPLIANLAWIASNLPAWNRFRRALKHPGVTQRRRLLHYLRTNQTTAFGREHQFERLTCYEEFVRRVPLRLYNGFEPWMDRVRRGEPNVLCREPVTLLVPTSGTSNGRKLIPFTASLQQEFNAAIGPWLLDLGRTVPGVLAGPAYWSITPAIDENDQSNSSAIEVGFDSDAAYLGGVRARLVESVLAVPSSIQRARSMGAFRYGTLLALLRCRELRLVSIWHPSFLSLLLKDLPNRWEELVRDVADGTCACAADLPGYRRSRPHLGRARELEAVGPDPAMLWPHLAVISCWQDGPAARAAAALRRQFPNPLLQPKGLLATEACVTIPFQSLHPLAVTSHFFEFLDDHGQAHLADQLALNAEYEVVVSTAGGLWRYQLGDRVRVNGFVGRTPSLKFLGRAGNISDLFGEKLSEQFVAQVVEEVLPRSAFALLAPEEDEEGWHYTLYCEDLISGAEFEPMLETALCRNPQYAWCRKLGQLLPARICRIPAGGYERFVDRMRPAGARTGDVKPAVLSKLSGWGETFGVDSDARGNCTSNLQPAP